MRNLQGHEGAFKIIQVFHGNVILPLTSMTGSRFGNMQDDGNGISLTYMTVSSFVSMASWAWPRGPVAIFRFTDAFVW